MVHKDSNAPLILLLEVRELSLIWENRDSAASCHAPVLSSVSFNVQRGDCVLISGPSGTGKTSLLRCLARLEPKAQGEVRFRGQRASSSEIPNFRRAVVYAAQTPARYPLTVEAALREPFEWSPHAQPWPEEVARRLCARVLLPLNVFARKLAELSGGELKRVQLVRSLLVDPVVLLLDEPAAGLDEPSATALCAVLLEWLEGGERALVCVSHDSLPVFAPRARRLQLNAGKITEERAVSPV